MSQFSTQFSNLFIHYYSNKPHATCKLFISEPNRSQEERMGRLFGLIEIKTPSRENAKILSEVISTLEFSYYQQMDESDITPEQAFESALNSANKRFYELITDEHIYLGGNLNEITILEKVNYAVGLLYQNQLYFTSQNNIGFYLLHKTKQDYKIISINNAGDKSGEKPNKLFYNITQGELNPPDYLFIANSEFLEFVSLERILKTVTSLPPHKTAEYFKNSLITNEGFNFGAIIIKQSQLENAKDKQDSVVSISELNQTESSTEKLLSPSLFPNIKEIAVSLFNSINIWSRKSKETKELEKKPAPKTNFKDAFALMRRKLVNKFNFNGNQKILAFKHNIKLQIGKLINKIKLIPNLSKILLVASIILALTFAYSIYFLKHRQSEKVSLENYSKIVDQIEELKAQVEADLIINKEESAKQKINQAQDLLKTISTNSKAGQEIYQAQLDGLKRLIEKVKHITNIENPDLIADLNSANNAGQNLTALTFNNGFIFAFNGTGDSAQKVNVSSKEIIPLYTSNNIKNFRVARNLNDKIYLLYNTNELAEFDISAQTFAPITSGFDSGSQIKDINFYNDKLYSLDVTKGQIYRHSAAGTGFGNGTEWLKEPLNIKDGQAIAIDNNVWLLKADGEIYKLSKGLRKDFNVSALDPKLASPEKIFTSDETRNLYILESANKRIVVLDKNGALVTQYYSEKFENLKDMVVIEKDRKIYLLSGNKILLINIQ